MKGIHLVPDIIEKCPGEVILITYKGSVTYGTQREGSDIDFLGICFPPEEAVFGLKKWEQKEFNFTKNGLTYDGTIYDIRKFFRLAMNGNPNILESLFVEPKDVAFYNDYGGKILDERKEFLSRNKCYKSFTGYAYSQLYKLEKKEYKDSHRREEVEKYGYSLKNAYHLIRLMHQAIQILVERDLSVLRPERQLLLQIRNGKFTIEEIRAMADKLENQAKDAYIRSTLREEVDREKLEGLLMRLMKDYYGVLLWEAE